MLEGVPKRHSSSPTPLQVSGLLSMGTALRCKLPSPTLSLTRHFMCPIFLFPLSVPMNTNCSCTHFMAVETEAQRC